MTWGGGGGPGPQDLAPRPVPTTPCLPAGNSLSALLDGKATLTFLSREEDYSLTMPYAHCKGERLWGPRPGAASGPAPSGTAWFLSARRDLLHAPFHVTVPRGLKFWADGLSLL